MICSLRPVVLAFDAAAPSFDSLLHLGPALLQECSSGGHVLEVGGGAGEDVLSQRTNFPARE